MSSEIFLEDMSESVILHNYEVVVSIIAGLLAFGVGIYTAIMLRNQIKEQSKFSQRIADLEYIKLMEPKLLGIVYRNSHTYQDDVVMDINAMPTADWYKFHFMAGRIIEYTVQGQGPFPGRINHMKFFTFNNYPIATENKEAYITTFEEIIAHIGTPDLKTAFETSKWADFYKLCKGEK